MNAERPGVVLIGGDFQGVGVLHSLGRRGVRTFLLDSGPCVGRFCRYKEGFATCPPASEAGGSALIDFLLNLAEKAGLEGWMLFPNSDEVVRALSMGRARLEGVFRVPVPEWEIIRIFAEKRETHELAARLGIATPRTRYPTNHQELAAIDLDFPVIVKPLSRDPFYGVTHCKAVRADDPSALASVWEWACGVVPPSELMVQELIPGGADVLYSLGCNFSGGRLRGHVVAHRKRQHPMDFGHATTLAETVDIPELEALGTRFLSATGYEGLAEVEFMFDRRDGTFKLLEVNPRVWGWHTLAGGAGVDLPYLFYLDRLGALEDEAVPDFIRGVKWVRPITDVPTAMSEMVHGRLSIRGYFSSIAGRRVIAPTLSWDDPAPFFAELLLAPYLWMKRGF
jgi:D-aspartate ligase